jgi:hypothetical protein
MKLTEVRRKAFAMPLNDRAYPPGPTNSITAPFKSMSFLLGASDGDGIVNLDCRGMLVLSVARRLGSESPLLAYCTARANRAGPQKRRPGSAKLTMPLERQHCDRRHVGYRVRRRDGPADCCAIARLSELNRSGAWFLTPVSRASADLTQYSCPDWTLTGAVA